MAKMNFKDALNRSLQVTKQYIDEETKLDNVLDLKRTVLTFEKEEIILDEYGNYFFENDKLFYNLHEKETEIKINLNNTISDKEYILYPKNIEIFDDFQSFYSRIPDDEIGAFIMIGLIYSEAEGVPRSRLTVYSLGEADIPMTVNSFEMITYEYESKIQSKMIENVEYKKIIDKPRPIISIEDGTNVAIPFTDWIRFNKYNLIDIRTTDINNTPYKNSTGRNNTLEGSMNVINSSGVGIRVWNKAASGMENAKGLKFNISQELVDDIKAGFIVFSCTFEAVNSPTMVRLVSPNGLYSEKLIPFTKSHSGASTTGTFQLYFETTEDYSYELLAGDYYILFAVDAPEGYNNCLVDLSNIVVYIRCYDDDDEIKVTRNIDKFIERDNKIPYEPTTDYSPATKKYVDDAIIENGFSGDYNDLENRPCYDNSIILFDIAPEDYTDEKGNTEFNTDYDLSSLSYEDIYFEFEGKEYPVVFEENDDGYLFRGEAGEISVFALFADGYLALFNSMFDTDQHIIIKAKKDIKQLDEKFIPFETEEETFNKLLEAGLILGSVELEDGSMLIDNDGNSIIF